MRFRQQRIAVVVWLALATGALVAQQPGSQATPAEKGVIVGTVVDGATNGPVPNATVTMKADRNGVRDSVIADGQGRFVFTEVPAGPTSLSSTQTGFTTGSSGAGTPTSSGQPLDLAPGETATGIVLRMWKSSVVSGTARYVNGEPLLRGIVRVYRAQIVGGRKTLVPVSVRGGLTDDRGSWRIADLVPGEYFFELPSTASLPPVAAALPRGPDYAAQFYLDASSASTATIVAVRPGEERTDIDFRAPKAETVYSISGTVSGGTPGNIGSYVELRSADSSEPRVQFGPPVQSTRPGSDGRFMFRNVSSGAYVLNFLPPPPQAPYGRVFYSQTGDSMQVTPVNRTLAIVPVEPWFWASASVAVTDRNVTGIDLTLMSCVRVKGRVVFEGASRKPDEATLQNTPVMVTPVDGRASNPYMMSSGIRADQTFETAEIRPGQYELLAPFEDSPWRLTSILVEGREMFGQPLTVGAADLDVVLTFSDKVTQLVGTVRDDAGRSLPTATVYAFSTDRRTWTSPAPSRSVAILAKRDGTFQGEVTPGEYFVVAVDETAREDWRHVAVLELLARTASAHKVAVGQNLSLTLVVPKGR